MTVDRTVATGVVTMTEARSTEGGPRMLGEPAADDVAAVGL